jgi:hypothetical protein
VLAFDKIMSKLYVQWYDQDLYFEHHSLSIKLGSYRKTLREASYSAVFMSSLLGVYPSEIAARDAVNAKAREFVAAILDQVLN